MLPFLCDSVTWKLAVFTGNNRTSNKNGCRMILTLTYWYTWYFYWNKVSIATALNFRLSYQKSREQCAIAYSMVLIDGTNAMTQFQCDTLHTFVWLSQNEKYDGILCKLYHVYDKANTWSIRVTVFSVDDYKNVFIMYKTKRNQWNWIAFTLKKKMQHGQLAGTIEKHSAWHHIPTANSKVKDSEHCAQIVSIDENCLFFRFDFVFPFCITISWAIS